MIEERPSIDRIAATLAAKIICKADEGIPADRVLKAILREQKGLQPGESAAVADSVFCFYRWRGWLNPAQKVEEQVEAARQLAERWHQKPHSFSPTELQNRAVPAWTKEEVTFTPTWLRTLQEDPILWLRARPGHADPLLERFPSSLSRKIPGAIAFAGKEDLFRSIEFHAGEFEIQDIASQAVGLVCGAKRGETWWDACAGEGGKTLYLSDCMENTGLIWASDRSKRRLQTLRQRAARARAFNYRAVEWDGSERLPTKTKFDGILLDAPCSGVGTWTRNPHARWTTTQADVHELAKIQAGLLANCSRLVKPGGRLIYSVCTLTNAETHGVADGFQAASPDFEPVEFKNPFQLEEPPAARQMWWTQYSGGNGMFVAMWRRKANPPAAK
ncbi:MAG TPA: RsmB/NOP family class I SAM-dependent RNA methyltransferase [Candidatus Limnocylindria bacterium]|jgi:16S rRNA (cytosine967-C5)-methyltransferase|nr:RsmB/NOP family class I SAM-dependent RNA methyltransferase [Candidatus Limnocylindria bacterium]